MPDVRADKVRVKSNLWLEPPDDGFVEFDFDGNIQEFIRFFVYERADHIVQPGAHVLFEYLDETGELKQESRSISK